MKTPTDIVQDHLDAAAQVLREEGVPAPGTPYFGTMLNLVKAMQHHGISEIGWCRDGSAARLSQPDSGKIKLEIRIDTQHRPEEIVIPLHLLKQPA